MKKESRIILTFLLLLTMFTALILPVNAVTYKARKSESADALYFDTPPVLDGTINEYEWGQPTVRVIDDGTLSSSFSMRVGDTGILEDDSNTPDEYYDMWLRWDEKYFYVAVKIPDAIPFHQYADGSGDFWNGDVIQFGTDSGGNWEMQEGTSMTSAWGPGYKLHLVAKSSNDNKDYSYSYNYTDYYKLQYYVNNDGRYTSYEVAIPWDSCITDNVADIKAGKIIGFAMVVLMADDSSDYYGWLGWGDNICYTHLDEARVGNNAITLSSEPAVVIPVISPQTSDYTFIAHALLIIIAAIIFVCVRMKRQHT